MSGNCEFCGLDPYEYVDVGVGSIAVAVNCCELGYLLYDANWPLDRVVLFAVYPEIYYLFYLKEVLEYEEQYRKDIGETDD